MSENIIDVSNISKSFGGRKVVDGLSLSVAQGEVFGLLGHNGAGKSTTIEMILGIKKPDGGSAQILGKNAASARKEIFEKVGVQLRSSAYQAAIKVGEICEEFASLYNEPADYRLPALIKESCTPQENCRTYIPNCSHRRLPVRPCKYFGYACTHQENSGGHSCRHGKTHRLL